MTFVVHYRSRANLFGKYEKMIKQILLSITAIILISCNNQEISNDNLHKKDTIIISKAKLSETVSAIDSSIKLDFIADSIKLKIGGPRYTYDTTSLESNKYIFIAYATTDGQIQINGKEIDCIKDPSKSLMTHDSLTNVFIGQGFTLILTLSHRLIEYENGHFRRGSLEVTGRGFQKKFSIWGKSSF